MSDSLDIGKNKCILLIFICTNITLNYLYWLWMILTFRKVKCIFILHTTFGQVGIQTEQIHRELGAVESGKWGPSSNRDVDFSLHRKLKKWDVLMAVVQPSSYRSYLLWFVLTWYSERFSFSHVVVPGRTWQRPSEEINVFLSVDYFTEQNKTSNFNSS